MAERGVYDWASGKLDTFDGVELGAALFTAAYVPTFTDTTVDVLLGEVAAVDYERPSFDGEWDPDATLLAVAVADQWPSFVDSTGYTVRWAVVFVNDGGADDGKLIAWHGFAPYEGAPGDTLELLGGIADASDGTDFEDRLSTAEGTLVDHGTRITTLEQSGPGESGGGPVTSDDVSMVDGAGDPLGYTLTDVNLPSLGVTITEYQARFENDAWKQPVRAVATTDLNFGFPPSGLQTVDGVSLADGDLVLVTAQSTGANNGPFIVRAGTWERVAGETPAGSVVSVGPEGTSYPNTLWRLNTPDPIVLDTTDTAWEQVVGSGGGGALGAQVINLTAEAPGAITLDLSSGPYAVAPTVTTVEVRLPVGGSDLTIIPPDGDARGLLGFTAYNTNENPITVTVDGLDPVLSAADGVIFTALTMLGSVGSMVFAAKWDTTGGSGSGDVVGPASAVDGNLPTYDGVTGKLLDDSGVALASLAPKASPTFTGTPAAPTASAGANSTQIATTAYVDAADALLVPKTRTLAGLDLSADRSASAIKTALSLVKADVGLGSVTNDAQVPKATFPVTETIALGDETTAITTGTAKVTWRAPWAFTLTGVRASLNTASSSGIPTVDINESGTTVLSTKLTIDASELTSVTAATAAVISDSSIADDAEITFDIDVAGTGAKGLKVTLYGTRVV